MVTVFVGLCHIVPTVPCTIPLQGKQAVLIKRNTLRIQVCIEIGKTQEGCRAMLSFLIFH